MWAKLMDRLIHAPRRRLDMRILWPSCRDICPDLDTAKATFAAHAFHDKAWLVLGEDEIARIIGGLA